MPWFTVIIAVILVLLGSPKPVLAELPPHNPAAMQPDPDVPPAEQLSPIYRGPMEFYTSRFSDGQSIPIVELTKFGFNLQDLIIPFYQGKPKELAVPFYEKLAEFVTNYQWLLMPQEVTSKTIHYVNENKKSDVFCARIINRSRYSNASEDISSTGKQLSSNMEYSQEYYEGLRKINAVNGLHEFETRTPGYYDFNLEPEINSVSDATPYCMWGRDSTPFYDLDNSVTQLATFGSGSVSVMGEVWETLYRIVTVILRDGTEVEKKVPERFNAPYKVYLTEVTATSNIEQNCHAGDCTGYEVKNTKRDWTSKLARTRGVSFFALPEKFSLDPRQQVVANRAALTSYEYTILGMSQGDLAGVQQFGRDAPSTTDHPFLTVNNAVHRLKQLACSAVPQERIEAETIQLATGEKGIAINELCAAPPPPPPSTSNLVNLKTACTPQDPENPIHGGAFSLSHVKDAVENTARTMGIPTCVLEGVANLEGAYDGNSCVPNACGAIGPFAITIGHTYTESNGQCVEDTTCSECAAGYCPNTLGDQLSGYTEADLCDVNKAAQAATTLLKNKAAAFGQNLSGTDEDASSLTDAIIYAGNAYFGSNYVFSEGSNIEPNCSYGETLLKKYCGVTTYTCGTSNHEVSAPASSAL